MRLCAAGGFTSLQRNPRHLRIGLVAPYLTKSPEEDAQRDQKRERECAHDLSVRFNGIANTLVVIAKLTGSRSATTSNTERIAISRAFARRSLIARLPLEVIQEPQDRRRIQIGDLKARRRRSNSGAQVMQQKPECVAIAGDHLQTDLFVHAQVLGEEVLNQRPNSGFALVASPVGRGSERTPGMNQHFGRGG